MKKQSGLWKRCDTAKNLVRVVKHVQAVKIEKVYQIAIANRASQT